MEMKANVASAIKEMMAQMNASAPAEAVGDGIRPSVPQSKPASPTVQESKDTEPAQAKTTDQPKNFNFSKIMESARQEERNPVVETTPAVENKPVVENTAMTTPPSAPVIAVESEKVPTEKQAEVQGIVRPITPPASSVAPVAVAPVVAPAVAAPVAAKEEPIVDAPVAPSFSPRPTNTSTMRSLGPGPRMESSVDAYDKTVISKGTIITGDISSQGDLELSGEITGNVSATGSVKLWGRIEGNVEASSLEVFAGKIKGDIVSYGCVSIDSSSVVSGSITATGLSLDGKLKGDVSVDGSVTVGSNGVQIGRISARQISIGQGARLNSIIQMTDESAQAIADEIFA